MSRSHKSSGGIVETVKTVVYAVVIALFVRTVAYEPFNIPSGSMIPTLLVGDYLFVSKYSYGFSRHSLPLSLPLFSGRVFERQPERGDVVVFKLPTDNRTDYIKRVIGLPGDHIQVSHGRLYINGTLVERRQIEDYVGRDRRGSILRGAQYEETLPNGKVHRIQELAGDDGPMDNTIEYVVPEGHYFMMGDNRDDSQDSRFLAQVGYVPAENLVGKAQVIFFSADSTASLWNSIRWSRFFNKID
ncbi:MAG TPA: signal peptidase I [Candidatus Sulfotelmatobacter sp.]|jgi:signal peptidase I|nr:signal peptidase I [Candidatus Sulfotelmatobacter sp.]